MPVVSFQITLNNAEVSCEYIQTLKSNLEVLLLSSALYLHLVGTVYSVAYRIVLWVSKNRVFCRQDEVRKLYEGQASEQGNAKLQVFPAIWSLFDEIIC